MTCLIYWHNLFSIVGWSPALCCRDSTTAACFNSPFFFFFLRCSLVDRRFLIFFSQIRNASCQSNRLCMSLQTAVDGIPDVWCHCVGGVCLWGVSSFFCGGVSEQQAKPFPVHCYCSSLWHIVQLRQSVITVWMSSTWSGEIEKKTEQTYSDLVCQGSSLCFQCPLLSSTCYYSWTFQVRISLERLRWILV